MHADNIRGRRRHWSGRYGSRKERQVIERRFGEMDVERGRVSLSDGLAADRGNSLGSYSKRRTVGSIGFSKMTSKE